MRRGVLLVVAVVAGLWAAVPAQAGTVVEDGYLTVSDGTRLRYHLERPDDGGRHPVLLQYDGYSAGTDPDFGSIPELERRLLARGFALLGVSVRGTGCSGGRMDLFAPRQAKDGAEAVEWAARQAWSDGRVGMAGYSYPGIMQLLTAAERPPSLKAIVPSSVVFDLYRDVSSVGGLSNRIFGTLFTAQQKLPGTLAVPATVLAGDAECAANHAVNQLTSPLIATQQLEAPYSDSEFGGTSYAQRSPATTADRIEVPALTVIYWQDEQTGSRVGGLHEPGGLLQVLRRDRTWAVVSNGNHDFTPDNPAYLDLMERFLLKFVAGEDNGFERTPHVTQLHEADQGAGHANWTTTYDRLPTPAPVALHLRPGGRLDLDAPEDRDAAPARYTAPLPSPSTSPFPYDTSLDFLWSTPTPAAGRAVWTTPRLARDVQLLGSASLDVWVTAGATDADLQATITEVRPDGQEVYVQRGWLRASHRKLDPERSTATRPFHPSRRADLAPLKAGTPTLMRLEVLPFGHTFREGSALRLVVDSPTALTGDWGWDVNLRPQTIRIGQSATHPSKLVIGTVPGARARAAARACGNLRTQPCRPSIAAVPSGSLTIPEPAPAVCRSRRKVVIPVRLRRGERVRRVTVTIGGKKVKAKQRGKRVTVSLAGRPRGTVRVRVRARTTRGRTVTVTRRYRLCTPRA